MKKYSTVFFDLDGTIVYSGEGVTNSVAYALDKLGIAVESKESLRRFIGPPLAESFKSFYGLDAERTTEAIKYYREYYTERGIFEGYIYEGIEELLKKLKNAKKRIIVATSKPEAFARQILEGANIDGYFDYIAGATMDEKTRSTKEQVIEYALKEAKIDTPSDVIMVGDRFYDIVGAHSFGMDCIAVLYGYGSRKEFESYNADYIVEKPEDVAEIVLK